MLKTETIQKHKQRKIEEMSCQTCKRRIHDEDSALPLAIAVCVLFVAVLFIVCWPGN